MTKLFQIGDFVSHAGIPLKWKIECDALEDQWDSIATMIMDYEKRPFSRVIGIPRGGLPLQNSASLPNADAYQTPLGEVEINRSIVSDFLHHREASRKL